MCEVKYLRDWTDAVRCTSSDVCSITSDLYTTHETMWFSSNAMTTAVVLGLLLCAGQKMTSEDGVEYIMKELETLL